MNAMLVYMGDEQAGGEDAAIEFLRQPRRSLGRVGVDDAAGPKIAAAL